MKYFLILFIFLGCTQKYKTFHVIDKKNFDPENPQTPITKKLIRGQKNIEEFCTGQLFFFSNAKKESDQYLQRLVAYSCPQKEYLLDAKLTETWWTTIIYSRSCVELISYCPR